MKVLKRAFVGLAIAGAVFSMSGTAHAESKFYYGYPDSGNCNYWRSAVKAAGWQVSSCTYSVPNKWHFTAWR
ncbi:hypothetical protein FDA94_11825 [Herbidospora galbida]|uniref:Lactococcin 972 family bacteriocin n=1 Tax=Herbidospora galbida TaxID=2575442 RepID=A0A4U3MHN1_9ACTN|nr:hypothetical protein [Herbidospora galbida]TKK88771.1 hypothetical protein FDA94_11825 [Herbidospora galbida]